MGVALELSPLGCRALLGPPASALWDRSHEVSSVLGRAGDELWERLQYPGSWSQRFAMYDEVLTRHLQPRLVLPTLAGCWRDLVASRGQIPIARLAADAGYSRQHLTRLFREEFGLGPKLASRVIRFERTQRAVRTTPPFVSLAQVAAVCGYADQAHLTREFVDLAGCTPTELIAEDLPILQDSEPVAG